MTSSVPGRQSAIGFAVLVFGPAIAFLFFYTPQRSDLPRDPNAMRTVGGKGRELGVGTIDGVEFLQPQAVSNNLPSTSTQWSIDSVQKWTEPSTSSSEAGADERQIVETLPPLPDRFSTNHFASQSTIPKDYPGTPAKFPPPASILQGNAALETHPSSSPDMVPLKRPDANAPRDATGVPEARFGAGSYRPQLAPSSTPDHFPKPAPFPADTPFPQGLGSATRQTNHEVPPSPLAIPSSSFVQSAPSLLPVHPSTPTLHGEDHRKPDETHPSSLPPRSQSMLQGPTDRPPQFVRQPKGSRP